MAPGAKYLGTPSPHLYKWWKSYFPVYGLKSQVQSPYRQDIVMPWVRKWPSIIQHKITDNVWDVSLPLGFGIFIMWWADHAHEQEKRKHRS